MSVCGVFWGDGFEACVFLKEVLRYGKIRQKSLWMRKIKKFWNRFPLMSSFESVQSWLESSVTPPILGGVILTVP